MMSYKAVVGTLRKHFENIDSTNEEAKRLLLKGPVPEGLVITADYQSRGRGQYGRSWQSTKGQNVVMSLILRPAFIKVNDQFDINIVSSLAVANVVKKYCKNVTIKWPNDIYIDNRKVAGILIENFIQSDSIKSSIIGLGVNVFQTKWPEDVPNATSLTLNSDHQFTLDQIRDEIISEFNQVYNRLNAERSSLKETYIALLYKLNEQALFIINGIKTSGIIRGVDEKGMLIVQQNRDFIAYDHGSIQMQI